MEDSWRTLDSVEIPAMQHRRAHWQPVQVSNTGSFQDLVRRGTTWPTWVMKAPKPDSPEGKARKWVKEEIFPQKPCGSNPQHQSVPILSKVTGSAKLQMNNFRNLLLYFNEPGYWLHFYGFSIRRQVVLLTFSWIPPHNHPTSVKEELAWGKPGLQFAVCTGPAKAQCCEGVTDLPVTHSPCQTALRSWLLRGKELRTCPIHSPTVKAFTSLGHLHSEHSCSTTTTVTILTGAPEKWFWIYLHNSHAGWISPTSVTRQWQDRVFKGQVF